MVNELLSNTQYRVEVLFNKNLNNGETTLTRTQKLFTKEKELPTHTLSLTSTKSSIEYDYEYVDIENVVKDYEVSIYYKNKLLSITPENNIYSNLFSDSEYKVVVTLIYDLNDGTGEHDISINKTITTIELETPSVSLDLNSTEDTITAQLTTVDNDNILQLINIEIYNGTTLVNTLTEFEDIKFNNLVNNTLYTVRVNYSVDYHNDNDVLTTYYETTYSTLACDVNILSYSILNETQPKTNEEISIRLNLDNESNIKITSVLINDTVYPASSTERVDSVIVIVKANKLSGIQDINIIKLNYELNGLTISQDVEFDTISINIMSRLDIISASTIDGGMFYKKNSSSNGFVLEIDNPDGYEIKKIDFSNGNSVECYMIDNNHIFFYSWGNSYTGVISIDSITYIDGNNKETTRNYNQQVTFNAISLEADPDTNALITYTISTPEELLAIESNKAYVLNNDIDMSGYQWDIKSLSSIYLDGKGHTIKNISYTYEDEYTDSRTYGLFSNFSGTIQNIYFENMYYNVDRPNGTTTFKLIPGNASIKNVLFSGSFNTTSTNTRNITIPSGNNIYIVDDLLFNNQQQTYSNTITKEVFNSKEFKENTLNWIFTENELNEQDGFKYIIVDNSYIYISKYVGSDSEVVIPNQINGLPVVAVGDLAFEDCTSLKSITFPDKMYYLGGSVLKGCSYLESIYKLRLNTLNEHISIRLFGKKEFNNSYSASSGYIPNSLQTIELKGVTSIGYQAFDGCDNITIYCEAESKPEGWKSNWTYSTCNVVWGYKKN